MKNLPLFILSLFCGMLAHAQTTQPLGDWAKVTGPSTYQTGEPFEVTVELLQVDTPTQLVIACNWMKADGSFGGFLQMFGVSERVTQPGQHTYKLKVNETKPDLGAAALVFYLSPDGAWGSRTKDGVFKIKQIVETGPAKPVDSELVQIPANTTGRNAFSKFKTFPQGADFFPIGVWAQAPRDAGKYQELGMNFYYGLHGGPTAAQVAGLKEHGMGAICHYNDYAKAELRDDPIIWAWMHPDEPDLAIAYPRSMLKAPGGKEIIKKHWPEIYKELDLDNNEYNGWGMGMHPVNDIQAEYKRMKADDPDRPVLVQLSKAVATDGVETGRGDRSGKTWEYPLYLEGADAVSYDIYPVAYGEPDKLWLVPRGLDQLREWGSGDRPLMMILEAGFGPTWANQHQQRAQVWLSINHGASGIAWFVHRWDENKKNTSTKMPLDNAEVGRAVKELNSEIAALAPVLNSNPLTSGVSAHGAALDLGARYHEGFLYVFAVERTGKPGEATLKIDGLDAAEVTVINEGRQLIAQGGQFTDQFEGWGVHLYKIPLAKAPK